MDKTLFRGKDLCVYCRGTYGILTYLHLRNLGIPVSYFADRDLNKCGYVLDGVNCISYEELLQKDRKSTVVLVCKQNPEELIKHFLGEGFSQTYSYEIVGEPERTDFVVDLNSETLEQINMFRKSLHYIYSQNKEPSRKNGPKDAFSAELGKVLEDARNRRRHGAL